MFCGNCGTKNEGGTKFCGSCGTQMEQAIPVAESTVPATGTDGVLDFGKVKLDASNEGSAAISIGGATIKADLIFKIIASLLFVALLLPFYSIRAWGFSESVNGFTAISDGAVLVVFLWLIPIAIFILFQLKTALTFVTGKLFVFSTILYILGFIMLFIVLARLNSLTFGMGGASAGFVLSTILYAIAVVASAGFLFASIKK